MGENRVETSFVQYPSAWLGKNDKITFTKVSLVSQFEYAPPTRQIHLGQYVAWWNVITFGAGTRCTQIAVYGFNIYATDTIYVRRQHDDSVSDWVRVTTEQDIIQTGQFNHIHIDNEYLSAYLVWYTHLNICHVALNNITVKRTYDPIIIYDQLPKSQMDSHIDIFNKGNGSWFGSGWMGKGTSTLFCRLCRLDKFGWISFSYPIDFS